MQKKWYRIMESPLIAPDLGFLPMALCTWFVDEGNEVFEGEKLVELLAGPATFAIVAPHCGRLSRRVCYPKDDVVPGQILGYISEFMED